MLYCPLGMVCGIGAARHGASANLVRHEGRRARCEGRGALGSAGLCRNARSFHLAREGAREEATKLYVLRTVGSWSTPRL